MITFHKSIFVNRPVEEIFRFITDNEFFDRWMPGLVFSKMSASSDPMGVGSTFVQRIKFGSDVEDVMGRVVAHEPGRRWAYTGLGETYCFRRIWSFEPLSKGTKINFYEELSLRRPSAMYFTLLLRYKTGKTNGLSLDALKRDLESTGSHLPSLSKR